jgi:hypothetical protein
MPAQGIASVRVKQKDVLERMFEQVLVSDKGLVLSRSQQPHTPLSSKNGEYSSVKNDAKVLGKV